ncbi:YceI family protein [Pendulispora rubella]|uniref:YceI family protein n=1 Tax=Pendulispora rubella TaxID=2741070 RepID=A0ABZ2KXN2_9BACT
MKIGKLLSKTVAVLLIAAAPATVFAADWDVDAGHSRVGFGVKHMLVSTTRGTFSRFAGVIGIDDADVTKSRVHIDIEAASINTDNTKRDDHLKSPDFLDVGKYPKIVFDSTKVERAGADRLNVTGNLTIKGVTRPVVLSVSGLTPEVKDPWGGIRRAAQASTKINRKDFGMTWNKAIEGGGVVVSDEVQIDLEVELTKKK